MRVAVTQEDIDGATPMNCDNCAIARALRRQTGDPDWQVGMEMAFTTEGPLYLLPLTALGFVSLFDAGLAVVPFVFELEDCCVRR